MNNIEQIRDRFKHDRFATLSGAVIDEIDKDYAKCSLKIEDRHLNAMGYLMGGLIFTLADFAFAVATNWEREGTVSLNSTINFLGVAKGEKLIAEANCIRNGRTTCYYNINVYDDKGTQVAVVTATGYHLNNN